MSKVSYDQLSINKIIKSAQIPRGSFYEYFNDKDDLLMFLMKNFSDFMDDAIDNSFKENGRDIFALVVAIYDSVITFVAHSDHRKVCENIFRCLTPGSDNMEKLLKIRTEKCHEIIQNEFKSGRYRIKTKEDTILLWRTLTELLVMGIARTFANVNEAERIRGEFIKQVNFIKFGVMSLN